MSGLVRLFLLCVLLLEAGCSSFVPLRQEFELVQVVDGDSLFLRALECPDLEVTECPKTEIRLLGLDAPEYSQEPWGLKAREFLSTTLEAAEHIYVEADLVTRDKYGRQLSYVFVEKSANLYFVNEMILDQGYAQLFHIEPNARYLNVLKSAEARARAKLINIWDLERGLKMSPYQYRQKNKQHGKNKTQ